MKTAQSKPQADFYVDSLAIVAKAIVTGSNVLAEGVIAQAAHQTFDAPNSQLHSIVIDLGNVKTLDSRSIVMLNSLHQKTLNRKGQLVLISLAPQVREFFRISQLDRVFIIRENAHTHLNDLQCVNIIEYDEIEKRLAALLKQGIDVNALQVKAKFKDRSQGLVEDEQNTELVTEPNKRAESLDALIASVPKDATYAVKAEKFAGLNHAVRQQIAVELAPALNAHIQTMPHDDLDGKKKLCDFVNSELERFGLAVKCPNTGLPAKLKATTGHWPGVGRFHFEVYVDGKRKMPAFSDTLPELQLIDATPSQEPETPWQAKVGAKDSRTGRKHT